ncbi:MULTISPECIES: DUF1254 domain-containing protein [Roseobacteraceae]|uniref:Membrane protein n=1 Tax=Pseudosulfitobacter pseudonitzschiae TaxID=1402135 RepID=A0A221K587_9RHOB|nr:MULTISPECIES: DUF1254 domain-containing protein [Roseobacteraceae]ASM74146.1 membrane protein [Pseudosulfitobacter pseudonitzschiae]
MPRDTETDAPADFSAIAAQAYTYAMPLLALETFRRRRIENGAMHRMMHYRDLLTPDDRQITTPNNDTLYTDLWLDLDRGPARVTVPGTQGRYISLHLLDAYTNTIAVLGSRTTGPDAIEVTLVGPTASTEGIEGPVVRCATPTVLGLYRILADNPDDVTWPRGIQDEITLDAPAYDGDELPPVDRHASWQSFFTEANRLIRKNPPPATDTEILRRIAPLGIGPDTVFDPSRFTGEEGEAISEGLRRCSDRMARIQASMGRGGAGWVPPRRNLGVYGQDYFLRAVVAVGGLGALPLEEASYFRSGGVGGEPFVGSRAWRLHFPADRMLPTEAFWSLSLYEPTPEGEFYFVHNPANRYAVGDRTPGLKWNADGSLDIWIGHDSPGADRESNWLPAPPGPFQLFLRAYLPRIELLEGRYKIPDPELVG